MATLVQEHVGTIPALNPDSTRKQIRGSSLLLIGRFLSVGINFGAQILMVRYLSTSDYGALGYSLSLVAVFQSCTTLQLQEVVSRFVPIYHETRQYNKMVGTILLTVGMVLGASALTIGAFHAMPGAVERFVIRDPLPRQLLSIMIFVVPMEALNAILMCLFASFSRSRTIFFRRHILGPGLRFLVVFFLLLTQSRVLFVAYGYMIASAAGLVYYVWMLLDLFRKQNLLEGVTIRALQFPVKDLLSYNIPVLSASLVGLVIDSFAVFLLGRYYNTAEVAHYRVALPAAQMNATVMGSFTMLYTPSAARMFAKKDYQGINELYWRTAVWMAVLTFPIFVTTFSVARPLTILLYGSRYQESGLILALLSLGTYFNVALGFNGLTVKVLGKLRYTVVINVSAAIFAVIANVLLIPRYGALGAAIGTCSAMIVHNLLKQAGLYLASGLRVFERKYMSFYLQIAGSALGLFVLQYFTNRYVSLALAGLVSVVIFAVNRKHLRVKETFPEVLRFPLLRAILQ